LDISKYCILVAEDNVVVRYITTHTLRKRGYCIIEACDGPDAIQRAAEYDGIIHVLVTNVRMPDMDGHKLAQKLKATRPDLKILILSADHEDDFPPEAHAHDTALLKPVYPDTLLTEVARLLRERGDVPASES
jgi:CheY-like chemotaxis protein